MRSKLIVHHDLLQIHAGTGNTAFSGLSTSKWTITARKIIEDSHHILAGSEILRRRWGFRVAVAVIAGLVNHESGAGLWGRRLCGRGLLISSSSAPQPFPNTLTVLPHLILACFSEDRMFANSWIQRCYVNKKNLGLKFDFSLEIFRYFSFLWVWELTNSKPRIAHPSLFWNSR